MVQSDSKVKFAWETMKKKFIAHEGDIFTIEWYFNNKGNSSALEYFQGLSSKQKDKVLYLFLLLGYRGKIFNKEKFRNEGDQIFAFKPVPDRFLCFFFDGSKVIVTNAYEKKSEKMPAKEKKKALKAKVDYIKRYKEGNYYD